VSVAPEQPAEQTPKPAGSVGRAIITAEELRTRVEEIGAEITADYRGRPPLLVGVLKGAFVFMSDLSRAIDLPVEIDFMAVSSYGLSTESSGVVRIIKDLDTDVRDRHVVLVEDIVDSGLTTDYLAELLKARRPASLETCALLVRADARSEGIRYVGFPVPADWLVGYGLDVGERYRELPSVHLFDLDGA
jgi:hypoxanthine phosphoribosyltransferase